MTEEEALIRAREAAVAHFPDDKQYIRAGRYDNLNSVQIAKRALLDLDKPLPVDRDLADLRELVAASQVEGSTARSAYLSGHYEHRLQAALPTFRAIIQRRIDEATK